MDTPLLDLLDDLARDVGFPVVLEGADHVVLADAAPGGHPLPAQPLQTDLCRPDDVVRTVGGAAGTAVRQRRDRSTGVGLALRGAHGAPAGQVWALGPVEAVGDDVVAALLRRAPELGRHAERLNRTVDRIHQLHSRDVRALLLGEPASRDGAAADLHEDGAFPAGAPVQAVVVRAGGALGHAMYEGCLRRVRTSTGVRSSLHLARADHGILLIPAGEAAGTWAERLLAEATARWVEGGRRPPAPVVGVGPPGACLAVAAGSYRDAVRAAACAAASPAVGPIAWAEELGVEGVLAGLDRAQLAAAVPAGVRRLQREGDPALLDTLEAFLDHAGRVKATAAALYVHRATLYQRLRRIEEVTGCDVEDGAVRLALHLGVRAARLEAVLDGVVPPRSGAGATWGRAGDAEVATG